MERPRRGPRAAGRAAWRVQAFCLWQNLGGGGIHCTAVGSFAALRLWRAPCGCFRRAFLSNGVPAGRQPCGAAFPWSTQAMMATFLACSLCIVFFSFFDSKATPGPRAAGHAGRRADIRSPPAGWKEFAHNFALYAVLSRFASRSPVLFQKNPAVFAIFSKKQEGKWPPSSVFGNFSGRFRK